MVLVLSLSLARMVWGGPVTVGALQSLGADIPEYRLLSATVPYKYIGFAAGGFVLVAGLISWIEGQLSWRAVLIALGAVAGLILVYDVPFETPLKKEAMQHPRLLAYHRRMREKVSFLK